MKYTLRSHRMLAFVLALVVALLSTPLFLQAQAASPDRRVVSLYVDGETVRLATDATTVGEALERAGVVLGESDLSEPSADTAITEDSFNINVYRARPVTVIDGEARAQVLTAFQSPALIAEAAGLKVYPEDTYEFERVTDFLSERAVGLKMIITRATPIKLSMYGKPLNLRTHAQKIGDLFAEQQIDIGPDDIVRPGRDTEISEGIKIRVSRVGTDIIARQEVIHHGQETIRDTSMPVGERQVRTEGQNGSKLVTYEITYHDDKEVGRKVLNEVVSKQPVTEVVVVGVKGSPSAEMWAALRSCEAGGSYQRNSGNGYYGAYQFGLGTWQGYGGQGYPHEAAPEVQDEIALRLWKARGFQPWPGCRVKLNLP